MIPTWDETLPTVIACVDRAMRTFGGCPTHWLPTSRAVTTGQVAGVAVRHPLRWPPTTTTGSPSPRACLLTRSPRAASEATVRIAKADLVPTDANLIGDYGSWAELVAACEAFMVKVNARPHRVTRRPPVEMLAEEQTRLHRLPGRAFTAAFGETRKVSWSSTISLGVSPTRFPTVSSTTRCGCVSTVTRSSPPTWQRAVEMARRRRSTPGTPMIDDAHYPPRPAGPLHRQPKAATPAEAEFLALGVGARLWLVEAAAAGTSRIRVKMGDAVALARLHGVERVDWGALGHAATFDRFTEGDLASILAAHPVGERHRADDTHSLQPSTRAWDGFGRR